MSPEPPYPKRLIEVDLPIRQISKHARREKSIRHGHISTLHIWWARRPLAACRAVLCAALWPDPADPLCPPAFRQATVEALVGFATKVREEKAVQALVQEHWTRWNRLDRGSWKADAAACWWDMRYALLDFIADFSNWDASTVPAFLETARALTQAAHEALGGAPGTRPLVVDPFAGGGSIPLEALRVGADAFASDLNPIPVLLNKVLLEYIPKYGQRLADEVRKWGAWIQQEAEKELGEFYPKDPDGSTPIAYLWARTIRCEGPGCGTEVPLLRSMWLAKKEGRSIALQLIVLPNEKRVELRILERLGEAWVVQGEPRQRVEAPSFDGTVKRGAATCPCCGYTTPVSRLREQLKLRRGGAQDARLVAVVTARSTESGRFYRLANSDDVEALSAVVSRLKTATAAHPGELSFTPDEAISLNELRRVSIPIYGMLSWSDIFSARQLLGLGVLGRLARQASVSAQVEFRPALAALLGLAIGRQADACSSLARWHTTREVNTGTFSRQALGMVWDFAEVNPLSRSTGAWEGVVQWIVKVCEAQTGPAVGASGQAHRASAVAHPLPNDAATAWVTDPPYYDAVPYSHLSDYFYVWLRRVLFDALPNLFDTGVIQKEQEIVVDRRHQKSTSNHDIAYYERELTRAFGEGRRVLRADGIGTIVFASKTTSSWEAILKAVVDAGWVITASWPIDTEMEARVSAQGQARLGSSVHIVCRPREKPDGSLENDEVGDWRSVLRELPKRIHEWMPRLAEEGVVGADAIFACLGPALEIYSRYARVEKANGEKVELREYLEHVWAAVSREALSMIFADADASGLEEDARLTAMWLWTLSTAKDSEPTEEPTSEDTETDDPDSEDEDDEGEAKPKKTKPGFTLEFDAARKIAQGLGAHLEDLKHVVEIKGDKARLLPVAERTRYLFGKDESPASQPRATRTRQLDLFGELEAVVAEAGWGEVGVPEAGRTLLDRIHQAMILFAAGRAEALKRFLVDEGIGREARFWKLAQSLSALYPGSTQEKRWVDGVLARKKSLGLG